MCRLRTVRHLVAILTLTDVTATAQAQKLAPLARLNQPFPAATWRLSVDEDERTVAVGQADNSIAMYSVSQAEDRWTIPVPLNDEVGHRARPVALSPDGSALAYALPSRRGDNDLAIKGTASIRIMGPRDQRVLKVLGGLTTRAQDVKFSPDGRHLAAVLSGGCGLRLWRTDNWEQVFSDDQGYAGSSPITCQTATALQHDTLPNTFSVAFTPKPDRWVVTSGGTGVRAYAQRGQSAELQRHRLPEEIGLAVPDGIALSPDGLLVAVGDQDPLRPRGSTARVGITVLSLAELKPVRRLEVGDAELQFPDLVSLAATKGAARQFGLARVAWLRSAGVDWLVAAGAFPCIAVREHLLLAKTPPKRQDLCAARWRWDEQGPARFIAVGTERINDILSLPRQGSFIVLSNRHIQASYPDGTLPKLASDRSHVGSVDFRFDSPAVDLRAAGSSQSERLGIFLSSDARVMHFVEYGLPSGGRAPAKITFDVGRLTLTQAAAPPPELAESRHPEVLTGPSAGWLDQMVPPRFRGEALEELQGRSEVFRSAVAIGDTRMALISSDHLRIVGRIGDRVRVMCAMRIQSEGFRISMSGDGRWLVTGHGDGTVRWHRLSLGDDGSCRLEHRLSVLFTRATGGGDWAWVAWLPQTGEFAASGTALNPLAWQIPDRSCDSATVPSDRLTSLMYNRAAVAHSLAAQRREDAGMAVLAERLRAFCDRVRITVRSPQPKVRVGTASLDVTLEINDESAVPRTLLIELGDGTRLTKSVAGQTYAGDDAIPIDRRSSLELKVDLPPDRLVQDSDFHVCFVLGISRSCTPLKWGGPKPSPRTRRLWAVLVGVSEYGDPARISSLRFARNDAVDLARLFIDDLKQALLNNQVPEYESVDVQLLVTPQSYDGVVDADLRDLIDSTWVRVGRPTPQGLKAALHYVADRAGKSLLHDDLVLVHFSGHGQANPAGHATGQWRIFTPLDPQIADTSTAAIHSSDLIQWLGRIKGTRVVMFDACRNLDPKVIDSGFDPAKVSGEFAHALPFTSILFSAGPGQESRESEGHAFSKRRSALDAGNGLFSYALLNSLVDSAADSKSPIRVPGKITIDETIEYVQNYFLRESETSIKFKQVPQYVDAGKRTVLRKLSPAP